MLPNIKNITKTAYTLNSKLLHSKWYLYAVHVVYACMTAHAHNYCRARGACAYAVMYVCACATVKASAVYAVESNMQRKFYVP